MPESHSAPLDELWADDPEEQTFVRRTDPRKARIRALALSFGLGSVAVAVTVLAIELFSPPACDQVVLITVGPTGAATTQLVCR